MLNKCSLCGKFRKFDELFGASGDSDDCGNYDEWSECKYCCSDYDYELHFQDKFGDREDNQHKVYK